MPTKRTRRTGRTVRHARGRGFKQMLGKVAKIAIPILAVAAAQKGLQTVAPHIIPDSALGSLARARYGSGRRRRC